MLKKVAFVALAGLTFASDGASAAQATANMNVSATVTGTCSVTVGNLAFPTNITTTASAAINATPTSMDVTCTVGTPYTVGISVGNNTFSLPRRMSDGAPTPNTMLYNVCQDAGCTTSWDPIGTPAGNVASSGTGAAQNYAIFGQIPIQSTPPTGAYTDIAVVTVGY